MDNTCHMKPFFMCSFLIILFCSGVVGTYIINTHTLLGIQEPRLILGPYHQNPEKHAIEIIWQTSSETSINSVCYGSNSSCDTMVYHNVTADFHQIKITNLTASSQYFYKVISDTTVSKIYTFHTLYSENETITCIFYGDSRGVWDGWNNAHRIANAIEREQPMFVCHTGDLVRDGRISEQWIDFFSISNFIHNSTMHPAIGNHEYYSDYFSKYFPSDLKRRIYAWLKENVIDEAKKDWTEEQFFYKLRKKGFGPFKKEITSLPKKTRDLIASEVEIKFDFLFKQLNISNTKELVNKYCQRINPD